MKTARTTLGEVDLQLVNEAISRLIACDHASMRELPEHVQLSRICDVDILVENIGVLNGCLNGEYGISPERDDIEARTKIELELSQLISQRNALFADLQRRTCINPDIKTKEKRDRLTCLQREIGVLDARRSEINVRIYCSKRVHSLITAMSA